MDENKTKFVGYICPECGSGVTGLVSDFLNEGKMLKLKCGEESELRIRHEKKDIITVEVPCMFCPENHIFSVKKNRFFSNDFLALYCEKNGYPVFFSGTLDEVKLTMEESGKQLEKLLRENGADSFSPLRESEKFDKRDMSGDAFEIESILNFTLRELEEENAIRCGCAEDDNPLYSAIVDGENNVARIICDGCGMYHDYVIHSINEAEEFIQKDEIILDKKIG